MRRYKKNSKNYIQMCQEAYDTLEETGYLEKIEYLLKIDDPEQLASSLMLLESFTPNWICLFLKYDEKLDEFYMSDDVSYSVQLIRKILENIFSNPLMQEPLKSGALDEMFFELFARNGMFNEVIGNAVRPGKILQPIWPMNGLKFYAKKNFIFSKPIQFEGELYEMSIFPVTSALFMYMMQDEIPYNDRKDALIITDNCTPQTPVTYASYDLAKKFCNKLSLVCGYQPQYTEGETRLRDVGPDYVYEGIATDGYRIPTWPEWRYFARAGENTVYPGSVYVQEVAWTEQDKLESQLYFKMPVGLKKPNAWGLYGMSGNVPQMVELDPDNSKPYAKHNVYTVGGDLRWPARRAAISTRLMHEFVEPHYGTDRTFRLIRKIS